jgi:F0F1-type ATP synthase assembly protein I
MVNPKLLRKASAMSSAVLLKAFLIYGGFRLGSWLDDRWGTKPYLMFCFICLGVGIGLWWVVLTANRINKDD